MSHNSKMHWRGLLIFGLENSINSTIMKLEDKRVNLIISKNSMIYEWWTQPTKYWFKGHLESSSNLISYYAPNWQRRIPKNLPKNRENLNFFKNFSKNSQKSGKLCLFQKTNFHFHNFNLSLWNEHFKF